jgi:hypothetical protein
MGRALTVVLLSLTLSGSVGGTQQERIARREVRITAQQVRLSPPAYVFLVTNLSDRPLSIIAIGGRAAVRVRDKVGIIASDFNTPSAVTLPSGWASSLSGTGGTLYFSYNWITKDKTEAIKPGESRCDFRVELPVFVAPKQPLYADGVLLAQTDFQGIPFLVLWPDGEQTEGTILTDSLVKK